jgi:hypothetical protein
MGGATGDRETARCGPTAWRGSARRSWPARRVMRGDAKRRDDTADGDDEKR